MDTQTHPIKQWWARQKHWMHEHPKATFLMVAFGLVVVGGMITAAVLWQQPKPMRPIVVKPTPAPKPAPKYYSPLTGELVKSEADTTKPVTAIMIENSPDARPQSGLKDAEVVYEAVAEGGITRFLTLFQQHKPQLIGPVRSVRMYYVDWLTPYNASVAHVGGSYKSLKIVRNGSYRDIDQFFNPSTYWRSVDRYAPHNVYTSFKRLDALNKAKGYKTSQPVPFERADTTPAKKLTAQKIQIRISSPLYDSSYSYNSKSRYYARSEGGAPHVDREKGQIMARVVIALHVKMEQVFEDGYRESIATTGSGKATIFQDGSAHNVTWKKASRNGQLTFVDKSGHYFPLARGTTWISAVPDNGGSVSWR